MSDQPSSHMFSNWEKMVNGISIKKVPTVTEYHDEPVTDKFEIFYPQQTLRNRALGDSCHPSPLSLPSIPTVHLPAVLSDNNYAGKYEFSIYFEPSITGPIPEAMQWVYEQESHKLFVKRLTICPILFKIQGTPPPGTIIRGILTYKSPEHYQDGVIRCPKHKNKCKDGYYLQDHVMRCENSATRYETCPSTGRLSLVLPLEAMNPTVGADYFVELFKFTCYNSCFGGMNKRRTDLLFRLECGGNVLGRALVEVRTCASPRRDYYANDPGAENMLYQCKWPGCGNIFSNSSRIIRHVRSNHLGPRNHDDDGFNDGEEDFYFIEIELNPDENNPRSSLESISPPLPSTNPRRGRFMSDPSRPTQSMAVSSTSTHLHVDDNFTRPLPGTAGGYLHQTVLTRVPKGRGYKKKCRLIYGMEKKHLWCTQCRWKKACTRFVD